MLTVSKQISAPHQAVFEKFTDFAHVAENVRGIERMEILTDGPIGQGTRFRETRIMFNREATEEMEITDWEDVITLCLCPAQLAQPSHRSR